MNPEFDRAGLSQFTQVAVVRWNGWRIRLVDAFVSDEELALRAARCLLQIVRESPDESDRDRAFRQRLESLVGAAPL